MPGICSVAKRPSGDVEAGLGFRRQCLFACVAWMMRSDLSLRRISGTFCGSGEEQVGQVPPVDPRTGTCLTHLTSRQCWVSRPPALSHHWVATSLLHSQLRVRQTCSLEFLGEAERGGGLRKAPPRDPGHGAGFHAHCRKLHCVGGASHPCPASSAPSSGP